jgi:PPM family protein phosphatase
MAEDNFLRRFFGRSRKGTPVPSTRPTSELQTPRALGGAASAGTAGTCDQAVPELCVKIGTLSDVGCVRELNEDSIRVIQPTDPNELAQRGILVVIADGMGGHNAGEIASHLAVEVVTQRYADDTKEPGRALACAMEQANRVIVDAASRDARYTGMGTTCTALLLRAGLAYCAHVGDSRLYLARGNDIFLMTEDHSALMHLVRQGMITADEARHHPDKSVIVRALGARADVDVATWEKPLPVRPGDTFLMCSDGLYDLVEDNELYDALRGALPQLACERLVELARERGGPDNITVGIITVTDTVAASGNAL